MEELGSDFSQALIKLIGCWAINTCFCKEVESIHHMHLDKVLDIGNIGSAEGYNLM